MLGQNLLRCVILRTLPSLHRTFTLSTSGSARGRGRERVLKGPPRDNVFAEDELDNLDAMEGFINQSGTQQRGHVLEEETRERIARMVKEQQRKLKHKIMERKYFKQPQEVNLLTWKAKEQICYLHREFPDEWTPEQLAESFPVSLHGVHHILNSSFTPRTKEDVQKHDRRVAAHWKQLKHTLAAEQQSSNFQHVVDTGKLPLMINAGGSSALPMQGRAGKKALRRQKRIGVFESIVAGSVAVKAQEERELREKEQLNLDSEKLLKEIADTKIPKEKETMFVTGYRENYSGIQR
ncbi:neugrin-like [Littorina saxatilis]|uniref:Neugrin n=1 Tax=Littorina saxatilis TaxID=31220 RepID=A0AAN9C0Y3_9CAEN